MSGGRRGERQTTTFSPRVTSTAPALSAVLQIQAEAQVCPAFRLRRPPLFLSTLRSSTASPRMRVRWGGLLHSFAVRQAGLALVSPSHCVTVARHRECAPPSLCFATVSRLAASESARGKALRAEVERYSSAILFVCGTMESILLQIHWRRNILEGDRLRCSLAWQQSRAWRLTGSASELLSAPRFSPK